ncbi:MAG TPA: DUF6588 family protein [Cyclobacteriaceae bacterium]
MKKNRLLVLLLLAMPFAVAAQSGIGDIINQGKASVTDAKYLSEGYISPMMKAIGYGMNQGWYNTAKTHNFPGFDLTFSVNPVFVPSADKLFMVDNSKMTSVYLSQDINGKNPGQTGKGNIPTVLGKDKITTTYTAKGAIPGTFNGPDGIGINFIPMPTANLGIGLPKNTDLKVRFVPSVDLGKATSNKMTGSFSLWGVGVMHDIKQWIPGVKALPFDLSGFFGYTNMKLSAGVDKNQPNNKADFNVSATTIQALISKKLAVLTVYAGLGYNMATTKLDVKGTYNFNGASVKDPFSFSAASNGARATGGLRLKFGPLTLHGDYTLAKYKAASVGVGIAVR